MFLYLSDRVLSKSDVPARRPLLRRCWHSVGPAPRPAPRFVMVASDMLATSPSLPCAKSQVATVHHACLVLPLTCSAHAVQNVVHDRRKVYAYLSPTDAVKRPLVGRVSTNDIDVHINDCAHRSSRSKCCTLTLTATNWLPAQRTASCLK